MRLRRGPSRGRAVILGVVIGAALLTDQESAILVIIAAITVPSEWAGSVSRVTVMTLAPARRLRPSPPATMGM